MSTLQVDTVLSEDGTKNPTLVSGTAQATTSGTDVDFTGIPDWVTRITVLLSGVSLSGTDDILVQLGTSGGFVTSGYTSTMHTDSAADTSSTAGFIFRNGAAAQAVIGTCTLSRVSGNEWVCTALGRITATAGGFGGGNVDVGGTVTQVRITGSGTDTFDAGSANIQYE